ncbi:MAG: DUF1329 domain-containing protein [Deltaproteobacteria bacterium]|nr:DUF1329 domain-containing protein [Deltaproteobacteria bacterium]
MRKLIIALLIVIIALLLSGQNSEAFTFKYLLERDWKEEQQELFGKVDLRPGDLITKANWLKVKDLLPPPVLAWVKKGEWEIKIGKFEWDCRPDDEWLEKSLLNAGVYGLGERKEIIEVATGEPPTYVYGYPYPEIDFEKGKDAGIKAMHNLYLNQYRLGSISHLYKVDWIGREGYERELTGNWIKYYYWARPDGERPNPKKYLYLDLAPILSPYDFAGIMTLTSRMIDGTPDRVLSYLPSIRRSKRSSGVNRSDPFLGLDFTPDDGNGWGGNNSSMKWTFMGEKTILHPMAPSVAKHPVQFEKQPDGSWASPSDEEAVYPACLTEGWKKKPNGLTAWAPTNLLWIPRTYWIIKGEPLDPVYNYGMQYFYMDRNTQTVNYKIIYDKEGNYWRTILVPWRAASWGDQDSGGKKISFGNVVFYVCVNDRTGHASWCHASGTVKGFRCAQRFNDPSIKPNMFTPSRLGSGGK